MSFDTPRQKIDKPGWYDMGESVYHSDPCPTPSLSASCAKLVIGKSLLHAWDRHPRNPNATPQDANKAREIGKAVHAAVFGGADIQVIYGQNKDGEDVEVQSYQTKVARERRDEALASGLIPLLPSQLETIERMADMARERFDSLYGGEYHAERVAIWKCPRTGGWRRGMLDTSARAAPIIVDYKTTEASVDDQACIRRIYDNGMHIQAAAYAEAMGTLNPEWEGRVRFFFQWQEQKPPYALSRPIEMGEAGMTLGREQWEAAGPMWDAAVQLNTFPGYLTTPTEAAPPPWELSRWETQRFEDDRLIAQEAARV